MSYTLKFSRRGKLCSFGKELNGVDFNCNIFKDGGSVRDLIFFQVIVRKFQTSQCKI